MTDPIRIANCSGFYGDRLSAAQEMVEGGPIDVLTGDWLAELTMLILARQRMKDQSLGYAKTFVKQMEQVMATCLERGIKVVVNAGGLNPQGCAAAVQAVAEAQSLSPKIAWIDGDNLMPRMKALKAAGCEFKHLDTGQALGAQPVMTANAYLGCWGIVEALSHDADIVITGRTTDAAIVCGPAAWHHGWQKDDFDALAGAIAAGHVIECGCQATGGNYAFFQEVPDLSHPGFPIAEIAADGSSIITKHEGQGGLVSVGTVTAQLLYEIDAPAYKNPDVIARFDTIQIEQQVENRVSLRGTKGLPPPDSLKVSANQVKGWRGGIAVQITGLDAEAKAKVFEDALWASFPKGKGQFMEVHSELIRGNLLDPVSNEEHCSTLRIMVKDFDQKKVEKDFPAAVVELGLANIPGLFGVPIPSNPCAVCWPATVPADQVPQAVHIGDDVIEVSSAPATGAPTTIPDCESPGVVAAGETVQVALGRVYGARSGDKAGNANLGVWAKTDQAYAWLVNTVTPEWLAAQMPEASTHQVLRYEFPNLKAVNFVFQGLLGEGVAASTRLDAQAKGLGEYFRALQTDLPKALLE